MEKERTKYYILDQTGKEIVLNVFNYFKKTMNTSSAVAEASKATGVSERMIYRLRKEAETNCLKPPEKRGRKPKDPIEQMTVCDEYTKCGIRKLVNSFFSQNISPTLNMLLSAIKNDDTLQNMSRSSLHRLLKIIGFNYETFEKKNVLLERDDVVKWRHDYLRTIRRYREEGKTIVYTDETWISIGGPQKTVENNVNISTTLEQAQPEGGEGNELVKCKRPKARARAALTRFALVHAGNEHGFINDAEFHFLCKRNTVDPLYEMDAEKYEKWFQEKLLPNTPKGCVIVLDNASYHARRIKTSPTKSSEEKVKKVDKTNKTDKNSTPSKKKRKISDDPLKQESQQKESANNEKLPKHIIDELAEVSGRCILRIPPYHCELNAMEMVWNKIKRVIAENKCSIIEAYEQITLEDWKDYVEQVKKIEEEMCATDGIVDDVKYSTHLKTSIMIQQLNNDYDMESVAGPSGLWVNFKEEKN